MRTSESVNSRSFHNRLISGQWYLTRKEIQENSPSKRDGISFKKETRLRTSYSTFLQDLGKSLDVPQDTIATAITFCHRFYTQQSHAKNGHQIIAIVCMLLAAKAEETPRPLNVIMHAVYKIIHGMDDAAAQKIMHTEEFKQQKALTILGERLVLATLGFDLRVYHPYKHMFQAVRKTKHPRLALYEAALNFIDDGLRTSLCLQFTPRQLAAGAISLASRFLKVKLKFDEENLWWEEFGVTLPQLFEMSDQLLEIYEQRIPVPSLTREIESSKDEVEEKSQRESQASGGITSLVDKEEEGMQSQMRKCDEDDK